MFYTISLITISYYALLSLGFIFILVIVVGLWSLSINFVYRRLKASVSFLDYLLNRKKYKEWLHSNKEN